MEIYLIRHTAVHNPEKRCYGQSDIDLSPKWVEHFDDLKQKLGVVSPEAKFYSSPYKRCTQLAGFLSDNQFETDHRLAEMNFGDWEQSPWTAIDQSVLNSWMTDYVNFKVPGGESFTIMHNRCAEFWLGLISKDVPHVVVITHAGVIRSLLANIIKMPLDKVFQIDIDYSSITKITVTEYKSSLNQQVNFINR